MEKTKEKISLKQKVYNDLNRARTNRIYLVAGVHDEKGFVLYWDGRQFANMTQAKFYLSIEAATKASDKIAEKWYDVRERGHKEHDLAPLYMEPQLVVARMAIGSSATVPHMTDMNKTGEN